VPDYDRILEPEPGAYPCEVVGETLDRVLLPRRVALAVPAQVHRHYPMVSAKVLELGGEVSMVTRQAMHQEHGRLSNSRLFVEEGHPVATQPSHRMCLLYRLSTLLTF
jgi:hypothetical protein